MYGLESTSTSSQIHIDPSSTIPNQAQIAADFGGDSAAQLAAMVFLFARERSRDSAEQRDQIEGQIRASQSQQLQKLHQGAEAAYDAAVWQAGAQLVGGVCGLAQSSGEAWGDALGAAGGVLAGAGNIIAAGDKLAADNYAADAKHAENQAASFERSLESVNSNADDAKTLKNSVYDFLEDIQDTKAESDKALVSIRV
jgi:hypothetical protein